METTLTQYLHNISGRRQEDDYFAPRTMNTASKWLEKNYKNPFFPGCRKNVIENNTDKARELHKRYLKFLEEKNVPEKHLQFFRHI